MDTLTLAIIALVVLVLIGAVGVLLRRRQEDSSYGRMPLSLDDTPSSTPPTRVNSITLPAQNPSAPPPQSSANSVSALPPRPSANSVPVASADLAEVKWLAQQGNKIEAIKRMRELTGWGLKEAKDYVEAMPLSGAISPPPSPTVVPAASADLSDVQMLMQQGQKIQAIKRMRELTGMGLKEAKDFVEAMPLSGTISPPARANVASAASGDLSEVHQLAQQGNKIHAIKRYRELTGVGLKEAKDYVDRL